MIILSKGTRFCTSDTTTVLYHKDPAVANQIGSKGESELYVADSGASDHFIVNGTLMYNKQKPERVVAVTTDGNKTKIDELDDVDLECKDGVHITSTFVNRVSVFKKILISIGRFILSGWKIWYKGLDTMIMKKGDKILKFKKFPAMNDNMYYLTAKRVEKG